MARAIREDRPGSAWRVKWERWREKHFGGHVSIGRMTIYGFNAMHVAINIRMRREYLCLHPTIWMVGCDSQIKWSWYIYSSRNATPWAATWGIGPGFDKRDRDRAARRRHLLRVLQDA